MYTAKTLSYLKAFDMNGTCVVTFGKGHNFIKGVYRLKESCDNLGIAFIGFTEYPEGCPTHEESPFAFKFFCIRECLKKNYKRILWLDSSVVIKKDIRDVFEFIGKEGYFFIKNWHSIGHYCHDKALKTLNLNREESFNIPCLQGTNFGLNFDNETAVKFFNQLLAYSTDGITFPGPYGNKNGEASKDIRVSGHRHDQIPMSITALRLGMNKWFSDEHQWFIHDRDFVKSVASTVTDKIMSD